MSKTKDKEIKFNYNSPDYWYLSTFAPSLVAVKVIEDGKETDHWFPNVEVGFNWLRTTSSVFREKIGQCTSPSKARYYGSAKAQCPLRPGYDEAMEVMILRKLNWAKFTQNNVLANWLVATDKSKLIDYAPWEKGESFLSVNDKGVGKNEHGKIIMRVRERLASNEREPMIPVIKF